MRRARVRFVDDQAMLDVPHQALLLFGPMRTTLNLDPEAIAKVRVLAAARGETLGAVASELILRTAEPKEGPRVRNGVPLFPADPRLPPGTPAPDLELVNRLRDEGP